MLSKGINSNEKSIEQSPFKSKFTTKFSCIGEVCLVPNN